MVALRQTGGGGGPNWKMVWEGSRVAAQVRTGSQAGLNQLAAEIRAWLQANLHVVTGDMVGRSFANVRIVGDRITIDAGSGSDHAFWHEVRFHPQFRQCMDIFAPKISAAIRGGIA